MRTKKSQEFFKENKKYILPVINFEEPILVKGEGNYVFDLDDNKILDLNGGQFCTILGHSNPELKAVINQIGDTIQHTNTATLTKNTIEAMKEVHKLMPELDARTIFLATGSESVEFAIRYAKHITGKNGMVCFDIGYHGLTLGSQSITYGGVHARPQIAEIFSIKTPTHKTTISELRTIITKFEQICKNNQIAALIIEPVVSVGGMYVQNKDFINELKTICLKYNVLLIFDECQTCMGRTGEWFGYQSLGVTPDIVVAAKGIGLGYPVGLVSINNKYVEGYPPLIHYSSHQNDPFSAQIVSFIIQYMKENQTLTHIQKISNYFMKKLEELHTINQHFSSPRGIGLMLAVDLEIVGMTDYRDFSAKFIKYLLKEHKIMIQATNGGQTLRCLPGYLITNSEIDETIKALDLALQQFIKIYKK